MMLIKNEKETRERKKVAILMMEQFLLENGYTEALTKLEQETAIELNEYEIGDNIDFTSIIRDFEEYYNYKYDKKPIFFKKRSQPLPKKQTVPKKPTSQILPVINKTSNESKENIAKSSNTLDDKNGGVNLQIQGKSSNIVSVLSKDTESWEPKMLQGLPDTLRGNEELVSLAKNLQREIVTKNPNIRFDQIIGLENCKKLMKEAMLLPLKLSDFFQKNGIDPWSGVLLFGPPGTGKTQMAKAVATECGTTFFNISASSLISKYHGKVIRRVREDGENPIRTGETQFAIHNIP